MWSPRARRGARPSPSLGRIAHRRSQLVGHERVYSDKLALAMQSAHDPRYRPNHAETEDQKPQVVFFGPEVYESCEAWEAAMEKYRT